MGTMRRFFGRRRKPPPEAYQEPAVVRPNPEEELRSLRIRLVQSFVPSVIPSDKGFLPVTEIDKLVNYATIRLVLPEKASTDVFDFVCGHGKTLFLILVVGNEASPNDLLAIMESCRKHSMTDEHLPVDRIPCVGGKLPCHQRVAHHQAWDVFHDKIWAHISFRFFQDQAMFTAPVILKDKFIYELKEGCVLPITKKAQKPHIGHFSTVYEAEVHHAHHQDDRYFGEPLKVALKQLKPLTSEPGYNVETAWNHETSALEEINKLHHKHLIRPLAALRCGSEHYIMFEWADGGSLRELWESQGPEPKDLDPDRIMSVIEEILGIVGALSTLHGTNSRTKTGNVVRRAADLAGMAAGERLTVPVPHSVKPREGETKDYSPITTPDTSKSPRNLPEIQVRFVEPSDDEVSFRSEDPNRSYVSEESDASSDEHWRHGDLKPENILQFNQSQTNNSRWLGTLKIADLGLAKQHVFATARRKDMTNQKFTTSHYEAPEAVANLHLPRSRRFDIWSIGCVILEFVIIILYGNNGLASFYAQLKICENPHTDTLYFTVDRNVARVSDIASHWIAEILNDPECNRAGGSALADIVRLVRDRLLVVELPSENMVPSQISRCRADAGELKEKLEAIWGKAIHDESQRGDYLCFRKDRANIAPPAPLQVMKPKRTAAKSRLGDDLLKTQPNLETYTHIPLVTTWSYPVDNEFALRQHCIRSLASNPLPANSIQKLCPMCTNRDLLSREPCQDSFATIKTTSRNCELHMLVFDACITKSGTTPKGETDLVKLQRIGSHLFLDRMPDPFLSLCLVPTKYPLRAPPSFRHAADEIQIGLPALMSTYSDAYFTLLANWLNDCDLNHPDCYLKTIPSKKGLALPTKLLDVGSSASQQSILLCSSTSLGLKGEDTRYIALSHPWGDSRHNNHFSTTATNVSPRLTSGIAISSLPKTFKDAVSVTRALGIRYLWIDSLCIVQGPQGDFETEAQKMETVFSLAYCVIAASSASGTSSGFLSSRPQRKSVALNLSANSGKGDVGDSEDNNAMVYVCEAIDNFQTDVIDGPLNQRGWVLQERALARRTIYFTERQTYFECGAGVRCETLTKMTNNQSSFLGDPNFPQVALTSSKGGKIRLYESLYKTYSRLQFTRAYDRPIAIAGLEQRLVAAFDTRGGYGIFDRVPFFGRSLLWTCEEPGGMRRIEFPKEGLGRYRVPPSWSWMAYTGAIGFMDLPFEGVHWLEDDIRSPWGSAVWEMSLDTSGSGNSTASSMWHTGRTDQDNNLSGKGRRLVVGLKVAEKKIKWDAGQRHTGINDAKELRVVAVGRRKSKSNKPARALEHHVLVVVGIGGCTDSGGRRIYERVGVGSLPGDWITHNEQEEEISIF